MSKFDTMIQKQQDQAELRNILRSALKACKCTVNLYNRTGKQEQAVKLETFLQNTVIGG